MLISADFEVWLRNQNGAATFELMLGIFYQKLEVIYNFQYVDGVVVVVSQKKNNVP